MASAIENTTTVRVAVALVALAGQDVVLAILDRFRAKNMIKIIASWVLINPFTDRLKHFTLDFDPLVAKSRVVESAEHIVNNLFDRD